jgi:prepilin-type N-terminal cleavage/methylation domain-containing protein/prepilin-type processing-associated H-X9-DG protein
MKPGRRQRSKRAFTLIELLVVIAIIAILATLTLSVVTRAKARARTVICQNQLKQLGLAMSFYVDDHEAFPVYGQSASTGASLKVESVLNLLSPYLGKPIPAAVHSGQVLKSSEPLGWALFHCTEKFASYPFYTRQYDYVYNVWGVDLSNGRTNRLGLSNAPKAASVREPSDMVALADTSAVSDGWPGPVIPLGPYYSPESRGFVFTIGSQHLGKGNVMFCDGHLETGKPDRWMAATEDARRRWNSDNEPHPELWPPKK